MLQVTVKYYKTKQIQKTLRTFKEDKYDDPTLEAIRFMQKYNGGFNKDRLIIVQSRKIINPYKK